MAPSPGIFTIRPDVAFLDALAAGILVQAGDDPAGLANFIVLLPTRRACGALADAFLRAGGGRPLILPSIRPLGDVDEDGLALDGAAAVEDFDLPPAIPGLRRQLLLTRMILTGDDSVSGMTPDQAARLAAELARLIDQAQTERLDFAGLERLAPREHAIHWDEILEFLSIVTEFWPGILKEGDCIDPADRRNRLLEALAESWRAGPPREHVIAAGSTGSIPATADLLEVVAGLQRGCLVLPGLDRDMDKASREAALGESTHPQHGMLRLLERLGAAPDAVADWPGQPEAKRDRSRFIAEALRPAATTDAWRDLDLDPAAALAGVERVDCANEAEEAGVIALMLRHALETPGRTAALVTPDRQLARRVAAELGRWGIEIDDSAGQPLADTPPGGFLRLVAAMAASAMAPLATLSALKHPLAAGGMAPGAFRQTVRLLEKAILRGPRPAPGFEGLRAALSTARGDTGDLETLIDGLADRLRPLLDALDGSRPLGELVDIHIAAAESLAESDAESGPARLWLGDAGEALAGFIDEMRQASAILAKVDGRDYPALFDALIAGRVVRPRYGRHPRLNIWGPLEARLQHADLLILGGLNEATWPPEPAADPWMSRPMREKFGLPPAERRIGLAAHDFTQAFAAPRVALVRAARRDGAPSVPSRWLTRLDTVLGENRDALKPDKPWPALYHALQRPDAFINIDPPAPCPPLDARPRELSVTRIEMWMRDPYAIYASRILKLKALEPIEAEPGAADRGTFIHAALDAFVRENPDPLPADALDRLIACGEAAFGAALERPAVRAFWWPRFLRVAEWFLDVERGRRAGSIESSITECSGAYEIEAPYKPFTLTAKADRIDVLRTGGAAIIDYKTGTTPSDKMVRFGYSPQLPLEAVILAAGGFEGMAAAEAAELAYWRLTGGEPPGEIRPVKAEIGELVAAARRGLAGLVAAFDDPATAYHATPRPRHAPAYNDYLHLARTAEWSAGGRGDED